jgi:hypothetical protein
MYWLVFDKELAARSQQGQGFGDENVNPAKDT